MNRGFLSNLDLGLILPVFVLSSISLVTIFSVNSDLFVVQGIYLLISIAVFLIISHINYAALKQFAIPFYIISIFALGLILVLGIESRGAIRWFEIFGFRFQFSELAKPLLAVSLASFLSERNAKRVSTYFLAILFFIPIFILIFFQPDLGSALVYLSVLFLTLLIVGFPGRLIIAGLVFLMVSLPFFWHLLHDYQKQRILTFLYPSSDPLGTSYNAIQSIIAVGSGGIFGKGLGLGTQSILRFLPERHTDFIFATISESFGLVGALVILSCFAFIFYKLYLIFELAEDKFFKIFVLSSFFLIFTQFFINIGMNLGLLPVVGITLPFVSYGGSSLLSNFILLGIISSYSLHEKRKVIAIS